MGLWHLGPALPPTVRLGAESAPSGSTWVPHPVPTLLPPLGSTSSDCKTTSYFGFLFLRMTRPKAFFLIQSVGDTQKSWRTHLMLSVLWPHLGSQGHLWPLDPRVKMSSCGPGSLGLPPRPPPAPLPLSATEMKASTASPLLPKKGRRDGVGGA